MSGASSFVPGSPLPPALLVGGSARCLQEELLAKCLEPVRGDAEIERLPAAALQKEKEEGGLAAIVLRRLGSVSLFGARRVLVVIGGQELLRDKQAKTWIERPTPRAHLVIAATRPAKDGPYAVPAGLPVAVCWEQGPETPGELERFLERRLAMRGAKASRAAIAALVEQSGGSLDVLDCELEKLSLYRLDGAIEAGDVAALCGHTAGRDFDRLWQALMAGRAGEALAVAEAMAVEGLVLFGGGRVHGPAAVANALLPMLLARIRRVAAVATTNEKLAAAAAAAFGMKPGYVHFLQRDARTLGPRLMRWQAAAIGAEVQQKRGGVREDDELLEHLLLELAAR
jgi:DNA polymerase III delta subunit